MTTTTDTPAEHNRPATRRAAEKAAADLLQQQLLGPITDLFETRQALSSEGIDAADAEAQRIVEEAQARAAQVREDARRRQDGAHEAYASAYRAAQQRGWTSDQLEELGYTKPKRARRRSTSKPTPAQPDTEVAPTDSGEQSPESVPHAPQTY